MLLGPYTKSFSTATTSAKWRSALHHRRLADQIAAVLLHRHNWIPLLRPLLPPNPPSSLILRVLTRIQSHPSAALRFFTWLPSFVPDLPTTSKMAHILIASDLPSPARRLLSPLLLSTPPSAVINSMLRSPSAAPSAALSFVLECYADLRLVPSALQTLHRLIMLGLQPTTSSANALLEALCSETTPVWRSVYAAILRAGASPDACTWRLLARLLCGEGKPERAAMILSMGCSSSSIESYEAIMDCYCRKGDFGAAVRLLDKVFAENLEPRFSTYSSILDGACRVGDVAVAELIMGEMARKGLMPAVVDYDWVIRKLCELDHTHAASMFFEKARGEGIRLAKESYACMLRALSAGGRVDETMQVYEIIKRGCISVDRGSWSEFASGICKGEPRSETDAVLRDVIDKGLCLPTAADLSRYVAAQCRERRWREASVLLDAAFAKGVVPEVHCCGPLMEHYCSSGLIDLSMLLHDKMKILGGCLDARTYNLLLRLLVAERRIGDAIQVFDYMRERSMLSSGSFVTVISVLLNEKQFREAMQLHDEMLKLGLKPDDATYRHLIAGFA